jgi:Mg-chelatase subunit ChlD
MVLIPGQFVAALSGQPRGVHAECRVSRSGGLRSLGVGQVSELLCRYQSMAHRLAAAFESDSGPQRIAFLEGGGSGARKATAEVEFVFDCTGSMRHDDLLSVVAFKKELLDPFEFLHLSILGFSGREVRAFAESTRDVKILQRGMRELSRFSGGGTFLYESISRAMALTPAPRQPTTRTMIIFSDGISNETGRQRALETAKLNGFTLISVLEDSPNCWRC